MCMGDLSEFFLRRKLCLSHLIKSRHGVLRKNKVDTYRAPVFAPDYSATVLSRVYTG